MNELAIIIIILMMMSDDSTVIVSVLLYHCYCLYPQPSKEMVLFEVLTNQTQIANQP